MNTLNDLASLLRTRNSDLMVIFLCLITFISLLFISWFASYMTILLAVAFSSLLLVLGYFCIKSGIRCGNSSQAIQELGLGRQASKGKAWFLPRVISIILSVWAVATIGSVCFLQSYLHLIDLEGGFSVLRWSMTVGCSVAVILSISLFFMPIALGEETLLAKTKLELTEEAEYFYMRNKLDRRLPMYFMLLGSLVLNLNILWASYLDGKSIDTENMAVLLPTYIIVLALSSTNGALVKKLRKTRACLLERKTVSKPVKGLFRGLSAFAVTCFMVSLVAVLYFSIKSMGGEFESLPVATGFTGLLLSYFVIYLINNYSSAPIFLHRKNS